MDKFATCCVLSFDRLRFLKEMLGTMVANAGYPMEIIVHDDGSPDQALRDYLNRLVEEGHISTLILNPAGHNQGQGIALNRMFHMAKGDPIIKLDHDLVFEPDWLAKAVGILERNETPTEPEIGALGLHHYEADPVDHRKMFIKGWPSGWEEHQDFVGSSMVIPRKAWEEFGPFEERSTAFAEDHGFKMEIADRAGWALALPPEGFDLAYNQGFGYGPSTVVTKDEQGNLTSREIKLGPPVVHPSGK